MNRILMYHSIGARVPLEAGAELYSVSVERFIKQMCYVYECVEGRETRDVRRETKELSQAGHRSIMLTFDDGLLDNYKVAYPILKDLSLKAYFFVMPARVGAPGYMNWDKIKEMHGYGMIIGSHGMTHQILTELDDEDLEYEINESKRLLEKNLEQPVDTFSIPRGFYNARVLRKIQEAGYTVVFTSNPKDADGFKFGRISVKGSWSLEYFQKVLDGEISLREQSKELVKASAKKILGVKRYDKIRTAILKK